MAKNKIISAREAAAYIGVSYRMFLNMVKDGKIPYLCPNGKTRKYEIDELEKLLKDCKVNAR